MLLNSSQGNFNMATASAVAAEIWHSPAEQFGCAMQHASSSALDRLSYLLTGIRRFERVKEKSRGVFYCRSKAFLHFHEDPAGLFADLRTGSDWERFCVNSKDQEARLLRRIRHHLARSAFNHGA
jgi:hypothetical protein